MNKSDYSQSVTAHVWGLSSLFIARVWFDVDYLRSARSGSPRVLLFGAGYSLLFLVDRTKE